VGAAGGRSHVTSLYPSPVVVGAIAAEAAELLARSVTVGVDAHPTARRTNVNEESNRFRSTERPGRCLDTVRSSSRAVTG
jgi:hypothetical protein